STLRRGELLNGCVGSCSGLYPWLGCLSFCCYSSWCGRWGIPRGPARQVCRLSRGSERRWAYRPITSYGSDDGRLLYPYLECPEVAGGADAPGRREGSRQRWTRQCRALALSSGRVSRVVGDPLWPAPHQRPHPACKRVPGEYPVRFPEPQLAAPAISADLYPVLARLLVVEIALRRGRLHPVSRHHRGVV